MILLINSSLHIGVVTASETAFLRFYGDNVTMIGKGNGSYLVLLDLSAEFDTINRDTLFVIIEKYIGITGSALQLLKSYFSDRSQRMLIDDVMSGIANIVCVVPQGSVLGPIKLKYVSICYLWDLFEIS